MTIFDELSELLSETNDFICNSSNFSAFIFDKFDNLNWVGFYMVSGQELILASFQGKPACIRIKFGKGVCGSSVSRKQAIIVEDVHEFEGHIACDSASNSELVIPIIIDDKIYGVLDIDSPQKSRFTKDDLEMFSRLLQILIEKSNMEKIYAYYNL